MYSVSASSGVYGQDVRTDCLSVFVGLTLRGSTRVLAVVGQFVSEAVGGNGIRVDDRCTTTSDHRPDATFRVQDSKLERSAGGTVKLLDVRLFSCQVATEGSGPDLHYV